MRSKGLALRTGGSSYSVFPQRHATINGVDARARSEVMMEIAVLVERVANNGFRAVCGEPWRLESEAPTRAEALQKLREQLDQRVAAGAEVVAMTIGDAPHPLAPFAGMLQNDPLLEPWKQAIADYRNGRDGECIRRDGGPNEP